MKITLIRHTRVAVETGICYGWSDVGVAPSFETEASRVKKLSSGASSVMTSVLSSAAVTPSEDSGAPS